MTGTGLQPILRDFFHSRGDVIFAYLFGSVAEDRAGPLSDIDIAVYLDEKGDHFRQRLLVMEELSIRLGTEDFDLIALNEAPIVLKHEIIRSGIVLKENREQRVSFEIDVLREYLDTGYLRGVQRESLKHHFRRGARG